MDKLHSSRGETLVEVLASILIAALSVTLLFSCIMATSTMDKDAEKLDDAHYSALSDADAYTSAAATPTTGTVTISRVEDNDVKAFATPSIEIYGGAGVFSYKGK